jgi:D-lactate dehydrogenase
MKTTVAVYDTKPYDLESLTRVAGADAIDWRFLEFRLGPDTAHAAHGARAVCVFVNNEAGRGVLEELAGLGVRLLALAEALHQMALGGVLDGSCEATASALLRTLASYTAPNIPRTAQWPKTPRAPSCTLRRIAPQLRQTGIRISFDRKENRRIINISRKP